MKKNDYCMVKPLSGEEHVQVSGECMPPAAEQMEQLRKNIWTISGYYLLVGF